MVKERSREDLRARMREQLHARTESSLKSKATSGNFANYVKSEYHDKIWKITGSKDGARHIFDIVPFTAGPNYPIDIRTRRVEVAQGDFTYLLDFWAHRGIGAGDATIVCLAKSYNLECAVCEDLKTKRKSGKCEDAEMKKWPWAIRRVIYNVIVRNDAKEEDKGVQLLDMAHWNMEFKLMALAQDSKTGGIINFAHTEGGDKLGHSIEVIRKGIGRDDTQFYGHKLTVRDYDLDVRDLEEAICLDQAIIIPTSEEVADMYYGKSSKQEEHEESIESDDPGPEESSEDRRRTRSEQKRDREDKTDQFAGDDTCPASGKFGVDIDQLPECTRCPSAIWDKCFDQEKAIRHARRSTSRGKEEPEEQEERSSNRSRSRLRR